MDIIYRTIVLISLAEFLFQSVFLPIMLSIRFRTDRYTNNECKVYCIFKDASSSPPEKL
jgi:hypothetical protein